MASEVAPQTKALQQHAPRTADAAHGFAARVINHLSARLPQPEPGSQFLLDEPFEPAPSEVAEFNRHLEVAHKGPLAVLEHAREGTLLPEHLEASQTLYPKLHGEVVQKVADRMASHLAKKQPIPVHLRDPLGMILGKDLDHAHSGEALLSAQLTMAADAQQQPQAPPPARGGGKTRQGKTLFAERIGTGSQKNELHMDEKA